MRLPIIPILVLGLCLAACSQQDPKAQLEAYAVSAKTNRATAASGLIAAFKADQVTADDALTYAFDKLERGDDETQFAGAVLDMIAAVQNQLSTGQEFEIFWRRVGRLAFKAAEFAYLKKRVDEAESLMLAGGTRWQNEAYFLRYTDHDGLISIVMAQRGNRGEAIRRLEARPDLDGFAAETLEQLRKMPGR
ncbi:MAG: hypothetical protein IT435_20005 [Phycisphaerales bacterium]|nr:hypothetical protein [Phycisphaerales bacterium]